jgi:hypothetical protein
MRFINKVAWIVCADVSYQNVLIRFAKCRGYHPRVFFRLNECNEFMQLGEHPDLLLCRTDEVEQLNYIRGMWPALKVEQWSWMKLMALAQSESSMDSNQWEPEQATGKAKLVRLLRLIELLKK